jgi:thymidine phosphorylase
VLDVKVGSGAFLPSLDAARDLAESLVSVARGAGLPTVALITDMDAPLATAAGNALETRLAIDVLAGRAAEPRLVDVTVALGGEMLALGELAPDAATGRERIAAALAGGRAAEIFQEMVSALGGPGDLVEHPGKHLAAAPIVRAVGPTAAGTVARVETRALGLAVIGLGGGRRRPDDVIDPAVGLTALAGPGDTVGPDCPLAVVHARSEAAADAATAAVLAAYHLGEAHRPHPLIVERIE